MHSVLATVEAGEGVAIVSASAHNLRAENVSFFRLQPDEVRIDVVATWKKKEPSVALEAFPRIGLDLKNCPCDSTRRDTLHIAYFR